LRVALYARVRTEEQVEGYSIDAQRRAFHWIKDKHETFIPPELFDAAQQSTRHNISNAAKTIRSDAQPCALSGVARCAECGTRLRGGQLLPDQRLLRYL
jgi:hypothetical protein